KLLEDSITLAREVGERLGEVKALETLGEIAIIWGRFEEAEVLLRLSIEVAQGGSLRFNEAQSYLTLGRCYLLQGSCAQAIEAFGASRSIANLMNDKRGQAAVLLFLAEMHYESGDLATARHLLGEVNGVIERLANTSLIGHLRE